MDRLVNRREFIGSSLGAMAVAVAPGVPVVPGHPGRLATIHAGATRYVAAIERYGLVCHCLPPGRDTGADTVADTGAEIAGAPLSRDEALAMGFTRASAKIAVDQPKQPLTWQAGVVRQNDPASVDVTLVASDVPLEAQVSLAVDAASGLVSRQTTLRHTGEGPEIDLRTALASWFRVHEPVDEVLTLTGAWGAETHVRHTRAPVEPLSLESRAGKTGFGDQPYLLLRAGAATYVCQLLWSGNWRLDLVPSPSGADIFGGFNDFHFRYHLAAGEAVELPTLVFGRTNRGINHATQALHDYRRARRPDPERPIPVQFNTWFPYLGEPRAESILALVPISERLGCEVLVVDAGWYRAGEQDVVADWQARTGDWLTSHLRFPNGLREVASLCHDHGMRFGLWFEPEVIGSLSALPREHPEWLHHIGDAAPGPGGRAILNLGVPEARDYVLGRISQIVEMVGVDWLKWDFNTDLGLGGWAPGLPASLTRQDPIVAHYRGLYELMDAVRRRFPGLVLEACASGASRMDGGILAHAHVNWVSDQPSPVRKLAIHFGCQLAHPAVACNDWLVEWPPGTIEGYDDDRPDLEKLGDLPFRLRVAMLGSFGISARIDTWSEADREIVAAHVALYREKLRAIIHHGDQYLLTPGPRRDGAGDWCAIWYLAKDRSGAALFVFRLAGADATRTFALPDLMPGRSYRYAVSGLAANLAASAGPSPLAVSIAHHYRSELVLFEVESI